MPASPLSRRQFFAASSAGGALGGWSRVPETTPRKVIFDTDPGVDDVLALLFAMRSPELKIEAITAVAGNVPLELAVANALRMVEVAGRTDIPVAAGAASPLERRLVTATSHGSNGLGGVEFPAPKTKPVEEKAADLIHRVASGSPGEVSIIAVGPLTNVATALQRYPSLAKQIREIVLMGGSLSGGNMTPAAEFNFYVDPEAAGVVFASGVPVTMVGLDVTRKCLLKEEHVRALESGTGAISEAAARIARNDLTRFRQSSPDHLDGRAMHDPLAVATFIDRTVVRLREYFVAIETEGELTAGETVGYSEAPLRRSAPRGDSSTTRELVRGDFVPNASVAVEVNAARFFELFIGRLAGRREPLTT
ncbi:MAG TPA: nucleoside hydrolase [Bryobacteraceae bacterium]|nr:nucleoside hydrolase [Bryobacteraceae bacterium]